LFFLFFWFTVFGFLVWIFRRGWWWIGWIWSLRFLIRFRFWRLFLFFYFLHWNFNCCKCQWIFLIRITDLYIFLLWKALTLFKLFTLQIFFIIRFFLDNRLSQITQSFYILFTIILWILHQSFHDSFFRFSILNVC